ncbi:MAG: glycosyltransferase family A protein [Cyclobacteriaceae bacterium]
MYFSIIIPIYHDSKRLLLLLDSLSNQIFKKEIWEVIVINNDPNDAIKIEMKYPFPISMENEPNPGSYAARNRGIKTADGKILGFIDSDCIPSPLWLQTAYECFETDFKNKIGILTGPVPLFYKNPEYLSDAEVYEKYTGFTTEAYAKGGHAITANWFSYRSIMEEFKGFNSDLKSNGDSELSGQISNKYKIVYNPNLVVRHPARYHTDELVNKYKRLTGGTYDRKYKDRKNAFSFYILNFFLRRYRFAFKNLFLLSPKESMAVLKVSHAINLGVLKEYFHLTQGGETKR